MPCLSLCLKLCALNGSHAVKMLQGPSGSICLYIYSDSEVVIFIMYVGLVMICFQRKQCSERRRALPLFFKL